MDRKLILKHLNLLLVDDDSRNNAELYSIFTTIFQSTTLAHDARSALTLFSQHPIDIIITDIRLPGEDGLSLIEQVRSINTSIPIIILSAYTDNEYLFRAANLQIDGYIIKPLNFRKLDAALDRAVARLNHRVQPMQLADGVIFHPLLRTLEVDGQEVSLGSKECQLLELLLFTHKRIVSKEAIHHAVWPNEEVSDSALKNLLGELRKKLKYDLIKNRHGFGWYLGHDA